MDNNIFIYIALFQNSVTEWFKTNNNKIQSVEKHT